MIKLISFFKKDESKKVSGVPQSFSRSNKEKQNEILKKGAETFTRKFSKTFEKLAQE
jgi:hypothetical protein